MSKFRLVVELSGGLGNQLFQFAFGHRLAAKFGANLALDDFRITSRLTGHGSSLRDRRIAGLVDWEPLSLGKESSLQRGVGFALSGALSNFCGINIPVMGHYRPKEIGYVGEPRTPSRDLRVRGYFQSWKYVEDDFPLRQDPRQLLHGNSPSDWFVEAYELINEVQPIGVHLRRGDYAYPSNEKIGLLSAEYFGNAIESLQLGGLREVFVFSDDPVAAQRASEKWQTPAKVVVPPKGNDAAETLLLLSQCSAQVLSNSTFSWWSAALGDPGRRIIYPNPWFQNLSNPVDLTPVNWEAFPAQWI